jgi:hypothetical protein
VIESRQGARFSAPVHTGLVTYPLSCTMGSSSLSWGQRGQRMALSIHPHLPPLWALMGCPMLHITLYLQYFYTRRTLLSILQQIITASPSPFRLTVPYIITPLSRDIPFRNLLIMLASLFTRFFRLYDGFFNIFMPAWYTLFSKHETVAIPVC